jgi:hypothetical protein
MSLLDAYGAATNCAVPSFTRSPELHTRTFFPEIGCGSITRVPRPPIV